MKVLSVEPRTPAWYEVRSESWTASTAAVLCVRENAELLRDCAKDRGVTLDIEPLLEVGLESFYGNTLWKEWAVKTGRIGREKDNPNMARGKANETRIVQHFQEKKMFLVQADVTATSSIDPWLLASFDALAPQSSDPSVRAPYGFPVEAKCPAFPSRKKMFDARKAGKLAIMGLPYYWCQVQHQALVAEAPYAWFVAIGAELDADGNFVKLLEDFSIMEKVPRDERFLEAYHAAASFYYQTFIYMCEEPPKVASDVTLLEQLAAEAAFDRAIAGDDIQEAVALYLEAAAEEAKLEARRKMLEAKVIEAANAVRKAGEGVVILADRLEFTYTPAKGSVSWQKVAKALAKKAGLDEVPTDVIAANTGKAGNDKVAIKDMEAV
ncbi:YqaJ viral recombinase family protein [Paraburkholderia sp. EG287A]|uniref:YqaJ viral recombinase family protein n=1 Tax=Paraburkholderia sp. EG287A TaxID=3237012 RepID=UPI0034D1EF27